MGTILIIRAYRGHYCKEKLNGLKTFFDGNGNGVKLTMLVK
jgi:hypothetical protein